MILKQPNLSFIIKLTLIFSGALVLYFLLFQTFTIRYEENDDSVMELLSSGAYTGQLEPHLVFIHYFIGVLLGKLYHAQPTIAWYPLLLLSFHFLAFVGLLMVLWPQKGKSWLEYLALLPLVILALACLVRFQFTTTTALLAVTGVSIFSHKKGWPVIAVGVLLFVSSSLLRFHASILVLAIATPFCLYISIVQKQKKVLIAWSACLVLAFALHWVDQQIYNQDKSWDAYLDYNAVRGKINDNPNAKLLLQKGLIPQRLSVVDLELLYQFFPNSKAIELNTLVEIQEGISKSKEQNIKAWRPLTIGLLLGALTAGLIALIYIRKKPKMATFSISAALALTLLAFVSIDAFLKGRVLYTTLLPLLFIFAYFGKSLDYKWEKLTFASFSILMGLYFAIKITHFSKINLKESYRFQEQTKLLDGLTGHVIVYAGDYRIQGRNLLSTEFITNQPNLYFGGWLTKAPVNEARFKDFESLLLDDTFLFISKQNKDALEQIKSSFLINHHLSVEYHSILENEENIVMKFHLKP